MLGCYFDSTAQDVVLESQADVDAFDPATTVINGSLLIFNSNFSSSSDITDLTNLSNLTMVSEVVSIRYNDNLTNLDGLDNLTTIGGDLIIQSNENLISVGLDNLISTGGYFFLENNSNLTNLDGLGSLISIAEYLEVRGNNLVNFEGLTKLTTIGTNFILRSNSNLTTLSGLNNLNTIGGYFELRGTSLLTNLDGLNKLESIGKQLFIDANASLINLDGLANLTSIGRDLTIRNNINLINLDGFTGLTSILGDLGISYNNNLIDINGLGNITAIGNDFDLVINENLDNLSGLSNLITIGGSLKFTSNNSLLNLEGINNLAFVFGDLSLLGNNSLVEINALSTLTSIGDNLTIRLNDNLTNLDGLGSITNIDGYLSIAENSSLVNCCAVQDLVENQATSIGGFVVFFDNPSECSSEQEVLDSGCGMKLTISTTSPCIDIDNGVIQLFIEKYDTIPFYYTWMRQDDGLTGTGVSETDVFSIDMLGTGTYNITVTNTQPDTVIKLDILLSQTDGSIFEIVEVNTTNSSNGQNNGSVTVKTAGGTGPYYYTWSGVENGSESGVTDDFYNVPGLGYGEYTITIEDATAATKEVKVSLLDEVVQVIPCEQPLDIVILNDVSGSVDAVEYLESKEFFVNFLQQVNIGTATDESRAAIIEWSESDEQQIKIPITENISTLQAYLNDTRAFGGNTNPHEALNFGALYLNSNARPDVEKVLILSTDGAQGQISSSLIALADVYKAQGFHIISIAFDGAYSNTITRDILRKVASVNALAPGASAYSLLDADLAKNIVNNYLCPIDPGSSATAYFNRDGAIDIMEVESTGNCPYPDFVDVTIEISAHRELSIPAGTYITFYHNDPNQSGATSILTWEIPCAIPVDSSETYSITLPMSGPSNIFAVLNDDGIQGAPINFPITPLEEIAYNNNIDNERICIDQEATIQVLKYSALPIPACDTLVTYTINVCNISEVDAFGITVEDVPPVGFALIGTVFNDNGCSVDQGGTYDLPADCCFSLILTYDAGGAEYGYYGDQDVILVGPDNQTYIDFDGSTTTDEDVTLNGDIDCPSSNITFTKTVNIDESCDDGFVEFTFIITNEMNIPLMGLTFQDILPDPCTWAYLPYGENGLSIANPSIDDELALFTIDEVQANTKATFYMDASLNLWSNDGTLNNKATLGNVPDLVDGGFITLTSNTTSTEITASPKITILDTILVSSSLDTVNLDAILSTFANVSWTTTGDGQFSEENEASTMYVFGAQDYINGEVLLFISAESECNEIGTSVLILFEGCSESDDLEIQLTAENITCEIDEVEILVNSNLLLDSVSWSGPSNEGLIGNNLLIYLPGEYIMIGYFGTCSDTVSIMVEESLAEVMESYSICEGESLEINNEVYNAAGSYQQILSSTLSCDTMLYIDLVVLENAMSEVTYQIQLGEILDINGVQYNAEGQYMQNLIATNGCDSILIINIISIIEDIALITFDFDDCYATVQTMANADYSEFTPYYNNELECGDVISSNIYRDDPFENKHSCTDGLNDSYSMCVSSDSNCDFDKNSTKMVRIDIEINPNPNSEIVLSAIEFFQQGPESFDWINGEDGLNNYPTKFGIRILKDGDEIYFQENIPTSLNWNKEAFSFMNNEDFKFSESSLLQIQLLAYCPVGADSPVTAWDLEDLEFFGSCSPEGGGSKIIAGKIDPCSDEILDNVLVVIENSSETKEVIINKNGDFVSLGNLINSHINITAYKNDDHLKGVNSYDLLMIQRHMLGLETFEDPLQYRAADINYDGTLSKEDLYDLRNLILGVSSVFPSNYSYRFFNKKDVYTDNMEVWDMSERVEILKLDNHVLDADFVPVKVGDVASQDAIISTDISSSYDKLNIIKQKSKKGLGWSYIFKLGKPMSIHGLQFSLDLNALELLGIETSLTNFTEANYNLTNDGILHVSWIDAENNESASSYLFTLNLKDEIESEVLNTMMISEVYFEDKIYNLEPNFDFTEENEESISSLEVYPNPASIETIISFYQVNEGIVNLSIYNLEGKIIYNDVLESTKGTNIIEISEHVMNQNSGIYIIRLTDQQTTLYDKIIVAN